MARPARSLPWDAVNECSGNDGGDICYQGFVAEKTPEVGVDFGLWKKREDLYVTRQRDPLSLWVEFSQSGGQCWKMRGAKGLIYCVQSCTRESSQSVELKEKMRCYACTFPVYGPESVALSLVLGYNLCLLQAGCQGGAHSWLLVVPLRRLLS